MKAKKTRVKKNSSSLRISRKKITKKPVIRAIKKEILGAEEVIIERTKFSQSEALPVSQGRPGRRVMPQELPYQYEQDKIVLQVRDPWWCHAYWQVKAQTLERFKRELGQEFYQSSRCLRVYDISQIIFNGNNAHRFFDIQINEHADNWYIDTASPGRSWCVDFGLKLASGRFITILRSNTVTTPLAGPSWITDEEWMIPDDMFARLYGMGFGLGRSSPVGRAWQEKVMALSSPGVTSMASPVRKRGKKGFWLAVNCELIVYGSTEPDAKVIVRGEPVTLRQDGTFTLRFSLPDAKLAIPVKAVSRDKTEERTITPVVSRETR